MSNVNVNWTSTLKSQLDKLYNGSELVDHKNKYISGFVDPLLNIVQKGDVENV